MRPFLIPSPKLTYKKFLCVIIILIRQLIDHSMIANQLQKLGKIVCSVFIEVGTS